MARNEILYQAICRGDRNGAGDLAKAAVDGGIDAAELLNHTMIPALRDLGDRFSRHEVTIPDLLLGARAMQTALGTIEQALARKGIGKIARICIGTVKGDQHDIGKNIVAMMLRAAGYDVNDLGVNCDVEKFAAAVNAGARAVLCSALITRHAAYMKTVVDFFADRPDIPVIVGGATVTREFADLIGADDYGADAAEAVRVLDRQFGRTS